MKEPTLQKMIDKLVYAQNAVHLCTQELDAYCEGRYGFSPSDRDVDGILDSVYGGCGLSSGMSAEDFDKAMKAAQ